MFQASTMTSLNSKAAANVPSDDIEVLLDNTSSVVTSSDSGLFMTSSDPALALYLEDSSNWTDGFSAPSCRPPVTGGDSVECPVCHKTIKYKTNLKRHIADKHSPAQHIFQCTLCNKVYKTQNTLSNHMSLVHRDVRNKSMPRSS